MRPLVQSCFLSSPTSRFVSCRHAVNTFPTAHTHAQIICQKLDPASVLAARCVGPALRDACSVAEVALRVTMPMQVKRWRCHNGGIVSGK